MTTSLNMKQRIAARGKSGQKFIARNRAPRVQIEYDVEVYGSEKKVQLPFVMGVISQNHGASMTPEQLQKAIADYTASRRFG